jgi:hypothetical protein
VLKGKDEEYVKLLKRQAADVDSLLGAMARQLADLAAAYREELENVERALLQVRGWGYRSTVVSTATVTVLQMMGLS